MNISILKIRRNFPDDPVVNNLPCNAGQAGLIPGHGTKIPHAVTTEPMQHNSRVLCTERKDPMMQGRSHMPQLIPDAAQ